MQHARTHAHTHARTHARKQHTRTHASNTHARAQVRTHTHMSVKITFEVSAHARTHARTHHSVLIPHARARVHFVVRRMRTWRNSNASSTGASSARQTRCVRMHSRTSGSHPCACAHGPVTAGTAPHGTAARVCQVRKLEECAVDMASQFPVPPRRRKAGTKKKRKVAIAGTT